MSIRLLLFAALVGATVLITKYVMRLLKKHQGNQLWEDELTPELMEKRIILLAAKAGGRITLPEICIKSSLSVDQAKMTLEALCEKEVMRIKLTEEGSKVYTLTDLASDEAKGRAIDLL